MSRRSVGRRRVRCSFEGCSVMGLQGMQMVRVDVGEYQCRAHHPEAMTGTSGNPPWWTGDVVIVKRAGE